MSVLDSTPSAGGCDGRCAACAVSREPQGDNLWEGPSLVWRSAVVFLLPLAGLAAGAALAGGAGLRAVGGAAAGGVVAVALARVLAHRGLAKTAPAQDRLSHL